MHGQKRSEYKARQRDAAPKLAAKAQQWHTLSNELIQRRLIMADTDSTVIDNSAELQASTLQLLDKMLQVNPDPTHLWNFRREILLKQQQAQQQANSSDDHNNIGNKANIADWDLQTELTSLKEELKS